MTDEQEKTAKAIVNIFETGRVRGHYGGIAVLAGDSGHLSYGRSQATLGSGSLYMLLKDYCEQAGARYAQQFLPLLPRFRNRDFTLDYDTAVRDLLRAAGDDPVMQNAQDAFFDRGYWQPATQAAAACGLTSPLSVAVVYDGHIQGSFDRIRRRVPGGISASAAVPEQTWIQSYIEQRAAWLGSCADPLPKTVYRMTAFKDLIAQNKWQLELPMVVHGVSITADVLAATPAPVVAAHSPETAGRVLELTRPYMRGDDVGRLQTALKNQGFAGDVDNVFGPMTSVLVKQFQRQRKLRDDGVVGPLTWAELAKEGAAAVTA